MRLETGGMRVETGGMRVETGRMRVETEWMRMETGGMRVAGGIEKICREMGWEVEATNPILICFLASCSKSLAPSSPTKCPVPPMEAMEAIR